MSWLEDAASWARADYADWVSLGEGGIQHGLSGWLTVTALRPIVRLGELLPAVPKIGAVSPALADLPMRDGPRPLVARHPIPHRQTDGNCAPNLLRQLEERVHAEHHERRSKVEMAISQFERHGDALYVPEARRRGVSRTGEIVHVHQPQGSLHVQLSSGDARQVYERGWGEPHGLSFLRVAVPRTWFLIYYPRDSNELQVLATIMQAALDWACDA